MAAMVGVRRGLLAARCSPRGALTAAPISSARRAGSPPSLPLQSLAPHRGAGSLTSERIYGDHHRELGTYNEGNYGESCSRYPTDRVDHQPQGDLPSDGSSTSFTGNRGVHIGGSVNTSYRCSRERPYQTGGSYGLPNSHQPGNGPRVSNETPGNNAREPYRSGGEYNLQGPSRDLPNAPQQHIGTHAPYKSGSAYDVQSSNRDLPTAQQQHIGTRAPYRSGSAYNLQSPTRELPTAHQQHIGTQAPYRSDSGYSLQSPNGDIPNAHRQHIDRQASYRSGSTCNLQSHNGDILNPRQQHIGTQASNGHSGYDYPKAYDYPNGHDMYRAGYNNQSNQQNLSFTGRQYGHGPSGQSYQKSTGNDQNRSVHAGGNASTHYGRNLEQPYQSGGSYGLSNSGRPYTGETNSETRGYNARQSYGSNTAFNHQNPDSNYANMPGNFASQYPNPSGFRMEQVAGFQQGRNGDFGYSISQATRVPYVTSKVDVQSNHPGYFSNVNIDVQLRPHGIDQGEHLDIQSTGTGGNNMNSTPYQDVPGSLRKDGSPFEKSDEASGKSKGTVEELEKLCEDGKVKEALEVLALLQENGIVLHSSQYFILLQACGDVSALPEAREIHNKITQSQLITDIDVNNKILEMYVKCGSMEDAKKLFSNMPQHNLTSWNTMISGFVHNGLGEEATDFFDQFKQTGVKPDPGMFTHVFLACGILGSVDEGMLHFESMQKDFGITPSMEHYASIVNMLGQSGYIDEAHEFTERMPVEPSIDVWESLMNMCRLHGFLELGERCAQIIGRLDPSRLNEQTKFGLFPVRDSDIAKEKERKKANAIEGRSKVHEYRAGDRSHPEHLKIYEELRYLAAHMKEAGYIADTRFVLHDVDQETKEDALLAHSERLAVSYGLITSAARAPIRVIKNLRSCGDCHTALKIISKLVGRQIIARDAKRFHHFENGVCSCNDYW